MLAFEAALRAQHVTALRVQVILVTAKRGRERGAIRRYACTSSCEAVAIF
jgi:hypothetical protein